LTALRAVTGVMSGLGFLSVPGTRGRVVVSGWMSKYRKPRGDIKVFLLLFRKTKEDPVFSEEKNQKTL
jgi:hypothetical protein